MNTIQELREHAEDMRCSLNLAPYAKTNDKAAAELEALARERDVWRKECEETHAVLDDPECLIIRNEKDGYPEGRPDRTLTLAERVRALLRMKMDYKRWMTSVEQERDKLRAELEAFRHDIEAYRGALGYSVPDNHDGKLSNGSTPECGLCNSQARKDELEALTKERDNAAKTYAAALVLLQNENDQLRTQNRELREAIEESKCDIERLKSGNGDPVDQLFDKYIARLDNALAQTEVNSDDKAS